MLGEMTEEERREFIIQERVEEESIRMESERVSENGIPLLFDLSYCNIMTSVELGSLQSQISDAVGFLRKQFPQYFKLICANATEEITAKLQKRGAKKWCLFVYQDDIKNIPGLEQKEIVYLSPDAEECLEEINNNCAYVIGGLVDRTIQSKKSLERGNALGVSVKRLPVKEYLEGIAKPERRVFNINTVVQALHFMADGIGCKEALIRSIPKRWLNNEEITEEIIQ